MGNVFDNPFLVFIVSLPAQWLAAYCGVLLQRRRRPVRKDEHEDLDILQAAILTLLALVIGFTFAMAVARYDQRKNYEEAEANAIGTEYLRADLLPAENATIVREMLRKYLDQRILSYETLDWRQISQLDADNTKLQAELWASILPAARAQPTPVVSLIVSGMNDVLNSQGYTQAAWLNRIPTAAWALMGLIAIYCNLLVGFSMHQKGMPLLFVLPVIVSISFLLIADIDSPRGGLIRVLPQNLKLLSQYLKTQ